MWFYFGLTTAICTTINTLIVKKLVKKNDILNVAFLTMFTSLPFMLIILFLTRGFPEIIDKGFYVNMGIAGALDFVAFLTVIYAIRLSDVSLLGPMSSITLVITTILAWLFLKETPAPLKLFGILAIAVGAYWINIDSKDKGILRPFRELVTHRGIQLLFISSILWSITPLFQKTAIFQIYPQSPLFASFAGYLIVTCAYLVVVIIKKNNVVKAFIQSPVLWFGCGVSMAISQWAAYNAFSLTHIGYATAIFKLSSLFLVITGALLFKEKKFKERLIGSIIILIGTVLLIL